MVKDLHRLTQGLRRSINLIFGRAVVRTVDDSPPRQRLQLSLLNDEIRDDVQRFQNYGFTSVPQPGADAVVIFAGGDRGNGVVIACDDKRYRIKELKKGEVCIYSDQGDTITLKRDNNVAVNTKTFSVNCKTAAIKNETGEIGAIISALIGALAAATAGGDLLVCPELAALKITIDSFKVTP